ncbi:VanZ family protein [Clostridium estertheticum]|nr:VanZ family protein [Clostridium estertheticum]MBZ9609331.1 VanZ family protein [Clostridium estertheticum]
MINALRRNSVEGIQSVVFALLICILYAIGDEVHQVFVPGRGDH